MGPDVGLGHVQRGFTDLLGGASRRFANEAVFADGAEFFATRGQRLDEDTLPPTLLQEPGLTQLGGMIGAYLDKKPVGFVAEIVPSENVLLVLRVAFK